MAVRRRGSAPRRAGSAGRIPPGSPGRGSRPPRHLVSCVGGCPRSAPSIPASQCNGSEGVIQACHPVEVLNPTSNPRPFYLPFYSAPPQGLTPSAPIPRTGGENSSPGSYFQPSSPRFSASAHSITWRLPNIHLCTFLTEEVVNSLFNAALQPSCRPWVGFSRSPVVCKSFGSRCAPSFLRGTGSGAERRVCPETSRKRADRDNGSF